MVGDLEQIHSINPSLSLSIEQYSLKQKPPTDMDRFLIFVRFACVVERVSN